MKMSQGTTEVIKQDLSDTARKPYRPPVLAEYGAVHHLTQGSGGNGNDGGNVMTKQSDVALKTNIHKIGHHPVGFGLYLFDYKPEFQQFGAGRQFGVMAQEVEAFVPEAVSLGEDGYRRVNYALLGIYQAEH